MAPHPNDIAAAQAMAPEAVGNWRKFESFGWSDRPDDEDNWCIVYTSNRDSGILAKSNAAAIEEIMAPFLRSATPGGDVDCKSERHGHWGCGYVDGYAIRVYRNPDAPENEREVTEAWIAWCSIVTGLENYPVLDDEDYSRRETEAVIENVDEVLGRVMRNLYMNDDPVHAEIERWSEQVDKAANVDDVTTSVAGVVYRWLWDSNRYQSEVTDGDGDNAAYPSEESVEAAVRALASGSPK